MEVMGVGSWKVAVFVVSTLISLKKALEHSDMYSYTSKGTNWHGLECFKGKNVNLDMTRQHS